jgi:hypothetical protein
MEAVQLAANVSKGLILVITNPKVTNVGATSGSENKTTTAIAIWSVLKNHPPILHYHPKHLPTRHRAGALMWTETQPILILPS